MLDAKAPEMMRQLAGEFAMLQQTASPAPNAPQSWLSFVIPLLHDGALQQMRLFIRREGEEDASAAQPHGHRFLIEVDMTQLGELQFDGFMQNAAGRRQFDLSIRSERPLPLETQQDIRTIYTNSVEALGF